MICKLKAKTNVTHHIKVRQHEPADHSFRDRFRIGQKVFRIVLFVKTKIDQFVTLFGKALRHELAERDERREPLVRSLNGGQFSNKF